MFKMLTKKMMVTAIFQMMVAISAIAQPTVNSVSPAKNGQNISVSSDIVITFSESMNTSTLTNSTISVIGSQSGKHSGSISGTTTVTFNPDSHFEPGEVVSVTVTKGAKNSGNVALASAYSWFFTVKSETAQSLSAAVDYSVSENPFFIEAADMDRDGDLDLVSANWVALEVSVLKNNGDGTFGTASNYPIGGQPNNFISSDLDNDGDIDFVSANTDSLTLEVLLTNNDGSLAAFVTYPIGEGLWTLTSADVNGDGYIDLITGNSYNYTLSILLNNGDGTFASKVNTTTVNNTSYIAPADVDGDGDIDLAAVNYYGENVTVFKNNGSGGFDAGTDFTLGVNGGFINSRDVDGDGDADLITVSSDDNQVSVLNNDGTGSFSAATHYSSTGSWNVTVSDVDGDGDQDLLTRDYSADKIRIFKNNGNGTFAAAVESDASDAPAWINTADLDGDGDLDVLVANDEANTISVLKNNAKPKVISSDPAQNALNVVKSTDIHFTFNEAIDEATLTNNNIKVVGSVSGFHSGTIQYNSGTKTVTFNPNNDFVVGETVSITLKTAIASTNGYTLASPYLLDFRVKTTASAISLTGRVSYPAGSQPVHSTLADFDNDGDLDIATANGSGNSVSVFLNSGPGKFGTKTDYGSGGSVEYVKGVDVNGDSYADILIVDRDHNTVSVFMNNQNGTFASRVTYGTADSPSCLATSDVDGDGDQDILTGNNNGDNVSVFLNNGNGTFAAKVDYPAGDYPNGLATGDFDKDGDIDFATSNNFSNSVSVFLNNGNGTFASKTDYSTGSNDTYGIQAGDLDNDGDLDLATGKGTGNFFALFKNNGDGTYATKVDIGVGVNTNEVNFSDVDGDGDLDIVGAMGYLILLVYNNGDATFSGTSSIGTTYYATNAALGDIDRDGKIDFVASNFFEGKISVFKTVQPLSITSVLPSRNGFTAAKNSDIIIKFSQDMNETTLTNSTIKVNGSQSGFHSSTFSFNHTTHELTVNPSTDFKIGEQVSVSVLTGTRSLISDSLSSFYTSLFSIANGEANGTFAPKVDYVAGKNPKGISLADFDNDGDLDMVITNGTYDADAGAYIFSILKNNNDGAFEAPVKYPGTYQTSGSTVADFNNDGYMDIAHVSYGGNSAIVSLNNGDGTFGAIEYYTVGAGPLGISSADMDGDGDIDLVTSSLSTNISIILNDGTGVFGSSQDLTTTSGNYFNVISDFDNDGDMDIAYATEISSMGVLINNGNLSFASPVYYATGTESAKIASGDFNKDGYRDILVTNYSSNSISVFLNNGNGTFASKVDYATGVGPNMLSVADFNNDGLLDAITGTSTTADSLSVLLNTSNGTFPSQVKYLSGDNPFGSSVGDLNNDGILDLVVVYPNTDNLSVFLGNKADNPTNGTFNNISYNAPTSLSGNVSVGGTLTVGAQITTGSNTIDLGTTGNISGETPANYIVGKVQTTRDVSTAQNNIGGMGISIDPQSNNLGSTLVKRETGTAQTSGSIKQTWTITPTTQPSGPVTVTLTWPSTNDNGINLSDLVVYKTEDGGDTWNVISATINKDTDPRTATFTISSFSGFTIGESGSLPVELISFTGNQMGEKVMLNWSTATESNNAGWEIETRQVKANTSHAELVEAWTKLGFVAGKGTTTEKQTYGFTVPNVLGSKAEFRLKQIDTDGSYSYSNILSVELTPVDFSLAQNYPNPFNPTTTIQYALAAPVQVELTLYNVLGQAVRTLVSERQETGFYTVTLNGSDLTSGTYFYVLRAGDFKSTKKLVLMK